ncbi:hypothetical protein FH972_021236 [Carpinus fangiana]|uniref:Rho-GAP domain-containing protein n=1 Tax=Carpinus fangiana TaxID=176857 RepID=A0A5N6KNU0_9ROSI|nr:hypothetical protein FH972_021236 [Carpinus fangiana]
MAHFQDAFWSTDYAGGLGVLFAKLQQGVKENEQVLTVARMRADAEELYGQHMGDIAPATDRITDGFSRDDGASVRKAYDGIRTEMEESALKHRKIASNIRELVVYPFGRWCDQHAARVQNSQDDLQARIKSHDKQADQVRRLRSLYYNKCRLVEDLEEEDKLAFKEPAADTTSTTSSPKQQTPTVKIQEPDPIDDPEPVEIGDVVYAPDQLKKILSHMLESIPLGEHKVPILGLYQNVSTGAEIVEYIQKYMNGANMAYAEKVGQDLIANGFLRLIGNVGTTFANSTRMKYQWRPKAFQITGLPENRKGGLQRSGTILSMDGIDSPLYDSAREYLTAWNPLNNPHPNETPGQKLRREAYESDERYKIAVKKLDTIRCALEEAMMEHLKFMERCELDRLRAIKSVVLDFSGAISNVIPSLQSTIDKMMLFQETVQPLSDLRYMLENYRTGPFAPKVPIYENYYNSVDDQTFGVELEARARADKKRVPLIITSILTYLDSQYPLLDNDEARRLIWIHDVPLAATHRLRSEINDGKPISNEVFERHEVPVVAAALKLYLLELPDPLVSSTLYEVIKTIYSSTSTSTADSDSIGIDAASTRVSVLQGTLSQLRLSNIASLDGITTHFARLIELTSADEEYVAKLAQTFAPCVLRPRNESALSFEEKYNQRFFRDLLEFKDPIFKELKRNAAQNAQNSGLNHSASVARAMTTIGPRPRATSSDESNRRANMEERNRAIAKASSRASSPHRDGHQRDSGEKQSSSPLVSDGRRRRDSSRGPPEVTRFPVATPRGHRHASTNSASLGVPISAESSPVAARDRASTLGKQSETVNGDSSTSANTAPARESTKSPPVSNGMSATYMPTRPDSAAAHRAAIEQAQRAAQSAEDSASELIQETERMEKRASMRRSLSRPISGHSVDRKKDALHGRMSSLRNFEDGTVKSTPAVAGEGERPKGVELVDRPMDD